MPLLSPEDVRNHVPDYDLSDEKVTSAIRVVSGWLLDDTGLDVLPDLAGSTDPDPLWSDAVELAGLVATNPELLTQRTSGPTSRSWSQAVGGRVNDVRERVRRRHRGPQAAAAGGGFGCFPAPMPWPDPPAVCWGPW